MYKKNNAIQSNNNWDLCKILTKDQLISFLKERNNFFLPTEREIKSFKWKIESETIRKKMDAHIKAYSSCTDTDDYNALIVKLNNETDVLKKGKILDKISKISAKIDKRHNNFGRLINKSQRIDKLLE